MTQAVSAWRERVEEIPSLFARLTYFATLKETETGPYFCGDLDCSPAEQDEICEASASGHVFTVLGFAPSPDG
jgi:hypothetical protein